jgi:hypothetical protein
MLITKGDISQSPKPKNEQNAKIDEFAIVLEQEYEYILLQRLNIA